MIDAWDVVVKDDVRHPGIQVDNGAKNYNYGAR